MRVFPTATMSFLSVLLLTAIAFAQPDLTQAEITSLIADIRSSESSRRYEALESLTRLGPLARQAVPELGKLLVDDDELARILAASALVRVEPDNAQRKQSAVQALARTMRETTRTEFRREAAHGLARLGAAAVPAAIAVLGDQLPETRALAAETLARIGAVAADAVPTLVSLLDDEDAKVRAAATRALGRIGQVDRLSIPALTVRLQDSDPTVRAAAADALGEFGPVAKEAAKALALALQDHEHDCCRAAAGALERLGTGAEAATPALIDLLEKGNTDASAHAACALANVGDQAVPLLVTAMKNEKARYFAMLALAEMGPAAKPAVPELVSMLADEDSIVRREVLLCLGGIGRGAAASLAEILERLNDADPSVQQAAAFALGNLGDASSETKEALGRALESDDTLLGVVAARSLLRLDSLDESVRDQARQLLLARVEDPDLHVRVAVIKAFAEIPETTDAIQTALIRSLRMSEPSGVISSASDTLVRLGEAAVSALVSALRDDETRLGALIILGRIGPKAHTAVPAIAYSLDNREPKIRHAALIALGHIGPAAQHAIPAIEKTLRDPDRQVRDAAAYALQAINGGAAEPTP